MERPTRKATIALTLLGLFALAAPVKAEFGYPDIAPQASIEACVESIGKEADYSGAERVRHEVESEARRRHGHLLRISTLVYSAESDAPIREYRTRCATTHSSKQVAFRIRASQ